MHKATLFIPIPRLVAALALLAIAGCSSGLGGLDSKTDQAQAWRKANPSVRLASLEGAEPDPKGLFAPRQPKRQARSLMVVGDSLSIGLGERLERTLGQDSGIGFSRMGKVSSGLARPDFFDWDANMESMAQRFRPDVVLVMLGTNDNKHLRLADGSQIPFGSPEWDRAYGAKAQRAIDICRAASPRATVYWVGAPVVADRALSRDLEHINAVLAKVVRANPDCHYVDAWRVFADRSGNYVVAKADIQDGTPLRSRDGVHFTQAGAQATGRRVPGGHEQPHPVGQGPDHGPPERPGRLEHHAARPRSEGNSMMRTVVAAAMILACLAAQAQARLIKEMEVTRSGKVILAGEGRQSWYQLMMDNNKLFILGDPEFFGQATRAALDQAVERKLTVEISGHPAHLQRPVPHVRPAAEKDRHPRAWLPRPASRPRLWPRPPRTPSPSRPRA